MTLEQRLQERLGVLTLINIKLETAVDELQAKAQRDAQIIKRHEAEIISLQEDEEAE